MCDCCSTACAWRKAFPCFAVSHHIRRAMEDESDNSVHSEAPAVEAWASLFLQPGSEEGTRPDGHKKVARFGLLAPCP